MHPAPLIVDSMEAAGRDGIHSRDVVTVVGEVFTGSQSRGVTDNPITLDYKYGAIAVFDHPFAAKEQNSVIGVVLDSDKINKGMRLVCRETQATMMVTEFVQFCTEARNC